MGSFNESCALSGFSIPYGTPIRQVFLTQNPYLTGDHHETKKGVYHNDYWFARTPPLKGKYDDYGRAVHDDPEMAKLIADVLSDDVVERPVGPNQYHDPAVRRGETIDHYLEAAWEGRLLVAHKSESRKPLSTIAVMIREDVWQAFLEISPTGTLDEDVRKYYMRAEKADTKSEAYMRLLLDVSSNFAFSVPLQSSILTHLRKAAMSGSYVNKEELITACVELCRVEIAMALMPKPWIAPPISGQECHWDLQLQLVQSLAEIAGNCLREEAELHGEEEG